MSWILSINTCSNGRVRIFDRRIFFSHKYRFSSQNNRPDGLYSLPFWQADWIQKQNWFVVKLQDTESQTIDDSGEKAGTIYFSSTFLLWKTIREKQISLNEYEEVFKESDFKILLGRLTSWSMLYLKQHLRRNVSTRSSFSAETYRDEFDRFIKRFPVIGSSTHSIINSIGKGPFLIILLLMKPRSRILFRAFWDWDVPVM